MSISLRQQRHAVFAPGGASGPLCIMDAVIVLCFACFSLAAAQGTILLSPMACGIDSDLQNYAQIMEAARHPQAMAHDPVARLLPIDPGVPNLLTMVAGLFPDTPNAGVAIIKAGAIALFLQLAAWYALGRFLFRRPSLAVLLSLAASITFYWAYGTFWGATHSEPVPRVFFNAAFAVCLMAGCLALNRMWLRLVLSLLIGCCIFIHSVSALMCGAMFLTAFLLLPVRGGTGRPRLIPHLAGTLACLALFCLPVVCFLGLRVPPGSVNAGDHAFWKTVFAVRFASDWGQCWTPLLERLVHYSTTIPVIPAGVLAWGCAYAFRDRLSAHCRQMLTLAPLLAAGIAAGCLAVWCEVRLCDAVGRMSMSQEMLRGTRMLIPLCLICITCAIAPLWQRLGHVSAGLPALAGAAALCLASPDMQVMAARHTARTVLSLPAEPAAARVLASRTHEYEALQAVDRLVPADAAIFSPDDVMSVRYVLRRPLHAVHKDGNVLYYARARKLAEQWLTERSALTADPSRLPAVWRASGERWLLMRRGHPAPAPDGARLMYENPDWLLLAR